MKLSIIIVNYNTGTLTKALVESLLKQADIRDAGLYLKRGNTPPPPIRQAGSTPPLGKVGGAQMEIIVVDNDSKDESVSFLRSDFPEITVIENEKNVGLAAGVNRAIEEASGEYYFILNPDMIALPGAAATLVDFMDKNPDVGVAGGRLVSPNGKLQDSCFRFYSLMTIVYRRTFLGKMKRGRRELDRFLMKDFDHASVRDVDWLLGACLIVRADAVGDINARPRKTSPEGSATRLADHEAVGGMDEQYFLYFEDVDWCRRMWEAGWRVVYVPQAVFSHFYQRSSTHGALLGIFTNRITREHIKSAVRYFWKFHGKSLPHGDGVLRP